MRLNKLEQSAQPILDEQKQHENILKKEEWMFNGINNLMRDVFPEHEWNMLSKKEKWIHIKNASDHNLYSEAKRLILEYIRWRRKNDNMSEEDLEILWLEHKAKAIENVKVKKQYQNFMHK